MATNFQLFGMTHLAILGATVLIAALLAWAQRRLSPGNKCLRLSLAYVILLDTIGWDVYLAWQGQLRFPDRLPVEFCDVALYVTMIALFALSSAAFDLAYYAALAGCSMALLTPNLYEPFPSLADAQFFVDHALPVIAVLYMVWTRQARPRPGSVARMMLATNLLAAFDGTLDWIFKANYMYLRDKPINVSLLSFMGRWPWYIAAGEAVALVLFLLLYLPFRQSARRKA